MFSKSQGALSPTAGYYIGALALAVILVTAGANKPVVAVGIAVLALFAVIGGLNPGLGLVLAVSPILVSDYAIQLVTGIGDASGLQKACVIAGVLFLAAVTGIRALPRPVIALLLIFTAFLGVTLLRLPELPLVSESSALKAFMGYVFPWLFFLVGWKRIQQSKAMWVVAFLPLVALLFGAVLHVTDIRPIFTIEYTGVPRLTGGLAAAYMGSFGMFGVFAGMWLWLRGERGALLMAVVNLGVTFGSGTRGPAIVAMLFVMFAVLLGKREGTRLPGISKFFVFATAVGAAGMTLPLFLERTENQGTAQGLLSGRELAWGVFWRQFGQQPWIGNGIGANSNVAKESSSKIIQNAFVAPHNTYLQLLVDFGIVGAFLVVVALFVLYRRVRSVTDERNRPMLGVFMACIAFYAFFDNLLASAHPATMFALILCVMMRKTGGGVGPYVSAADKPASGVLVVRHRVSS